MKVTTKDNSNQIASPTHDNVGALVPESPDKSLESQKEARRKQNEIDEDLNEFICDLFKKCRRINETEWLRTKQQMVKARKYFDGAQNGTVSDSLEWREYDFHPNEVYYIDNVFQPHIQTALAELSRGRAELTFKYSGLESHTGKMICDIAQSVYRDLRRRLFSVMKKQQEDLSLLLNGIGARYTFFDPLRGQTEQIPSIGAEGYEKEGTTVCAVCKSPMRDAKECGHCGSNRSMQLKVTGTKHRIGYEEVKEGQISFVTVDPLGLTFDAHAVTIEDSSYLIWDLSMQKEVLECEYPDVLLKSGIHETGIQYKYELEQSPPNVESEFALGQQSDADTLAELNQGWFDPPLYKEKVLKKDTILRNGMVLKAGEKLGKYFPNGMYVAKNDDTILDLWEESKNDKWDICPYVTRLGTMIGGGTSVALANQDTKNDILNFQQASVFHDAFRQEFVDPMFIDPDNIPNDPRERAVLKPGVTRDKNIVGNVIDALPPSQLAPSVGDLDERLSQSIQNQLGTFSASGAGMPDLKAVQNTATGFQAYREISVGRFQPMLELRADMLDKEQAYKILELAQKHFSPRQWERAAGDYGQDGIRAFLECDLREDVLIEVAYESYMPRSTAMEMRKGLEYLTVMGQMMELQIPLESEYADYMADLYGIPQQLRGFNVEYSKARDIVQTMAEYAEAIVEEIGDAPTIDFKTDPMVEQLAGLLIQSTGIEIDTEMDNHEALIAGYRDWWVTDEAKDSPKLLKAAVSLMVHLHEVALIEKAIDDQTKMQAAQAPMMAQEQEMAEQARMQEEEARIREEQGMIMQGAAEMAEADAQREHELQMAQMEQQNTPVEGGGIG